MTLLRSRSPSFFRGGFFFFSCDTQGVVPGMRRLTHSKHPPPRGGKNAWYERIESSLPLSTIPPIPKEYVLPQQRLSPLDASRGDAHFLFQEA